MNLGQRIYELRKTKNLSQGDLADMLEVSRQSISKWETDTSIPELDKLIKMSEIFGISLDTLVKGEAETEVEKEKTASSPEPQKIIYKEEPKASVNQTQRIIGAILLCAGILAFLLFSVLGGILSGLLFSSPFIACGIICLVFKKRAGLWCAWAVYFLIDVYLSYATGIQRSKILLTNIWTEEMNFNILYFSWVSFICLAALIIATLISFRRYIFKPDAKRVIIISVIILLVVVLFILSLSYGNMISKKFENREYSSMIAEISFYRFISFIYDWTKIAAFTIIAVNILGFIRYKKELKNNL
ncbi:MAG: helix-turn-helix transcriptional regulator [Clostridia bacterium]|nr:helix-turn-helix transcriptional regulator [Clostridia bacterium]